MSWQPEIDELRRREALAQRMGGPEKQVAAEQMAHELRLPLVRLVDGTGGGGSVKSLETDGRTYVPANPGWEWVVVVEEIIDPRDTRPLLCEFAALAAPLRTPGPATHALRP